jgi:restriction system protein
MVASAFAASLSEDAGERSGLALSKDQLVEHLREDHPFRIMLTGDERIQRVGSEEYAAPSAIYCTRSVQPTSLACRPWVSD